MRNGVIIDAKDNVVVAIEDLTAGTRVCFPIPGGGEGSVVARQDISLFHKLARTDIPKGANVVKYGEFIGVATCDILAGEHVHTHNCVSTDELKDGLDGSLDTSSGVAVAADKEADAND